MIRIALRTLLVLLASAVVLVLVVLVALRVGAATWAVNRVLAAVKLPPGLTISAGQVKSNGLTWLEARDVNLSLGHGTAMVSIERLQGRLNTLTLLGDQIVVHDLQLIHPRLVIQRGPDTLRLPPKPRPPEAASSDSKPSGISIRSLRIVDGAFLMRFGAKAPDSITAAFEAEGSLEANRLQLSRLEVRSDQSSLHGHGAVPLSPTSEFDLAVTAEPLGWSDLRFLSSHFDRGGQAKATIHAAGTFRRLDVNLDAEISGGGAVHARGVVTTSSPPIEYRLRSELQGVDPTLFLASNRLPRRIDGEAMLELLGSSGNRLDGQVGVSIRASPSSTPDARRAVGSALFEKGHAQINLEGNLGTGPITIRGWLRPFDSIPSYDLKARARSSTRESSRWLGRLLGDQRSLTVRVAGRGLKPREADLRALAVIEHRSGEAGLLDSGTAQIRLRDGAADIRSVVGLTGGTVAAAGTATLDPEIEVRVDRGAIKAVDLAALIGDSSSSSLDAEFTLSSRGVSPKLARAELRLHEVALSYGSHALETGSFHVRADSGNLGVIARANFDGGTVEAEALAQPFEANPRLSLTNLRFRHLDLGRLVPEANVLGEISGTASGRVQGRRLANLKLLNVLTLEQSQIGKQSLTHARIETSLTNRRVALKADATTAAGRLTLAGFGLPFDSVPRYALEEVEFHELDLGQLLSMDGLRTGLTGSLRAEASGRKPDVGRATGRLSLSTSTINDVVISDGRVDAELNAGELSLSGMLRAQGDSVTLTATAHPFENRIRGKLTSSVALRTIAPFLGRGSLDGAGAAGIRLEGEWGSLDSQSLSGRLFGRGSIADVKLDSLETTFRMTNGSLTLDTLALSSNVGTLGGSGAVALLGRGAGSSGLRLTGQLGDLAPLGTLLGVPKLDIDSGGFTATVQGPADSLRLNLAAQGENLSAGARRVGEFRATLSGELATDRSLSRGTADVQLERLVLGGTRLRSLGLEGTKEGNDLLIRVESVVDQERSARLVTRLEPEHSRLELDTLDLFVPEAHWALAHPVSISYGDRIHVNDFLLASGGRRIAINGVVDRRGEQQLTATIDSLEVGRFVDLLGAPELDGELSGNFTLTGHAANPHAVGAVDIVLHSDKKKVVDARGDLDWSDSGLQLDVGVRQSDGDSLKVNGRIPLALSLEAGDTAGVVRRIAGGTLALDALTERFRIEALGPLFDPETIKNLQGTLRMNAHATGTLEAPQLTGDVAVTDAKIQIPRLGATYEKGQVQLRLREQEVILTQARLESGGGRLEAKGSIRLEELPDAAFDLQTTLSKFRVADAEDFRSSLSGKLSLVGTIGAPVLTGSLQVSSTDVYLQAKNLQQSAESVELAPEDQRILERRFGYQEASRSQSRKPLAPWKIDLGIQLKENTWLRRRSDPVMVVELGGKLDVRKAPGEDLTFFGEIQPVLGRSFVQVLGRRFDLKEGSVRLNGPLNQTAVAVDAEYRAATPSGAPPVLITTAIRADTGSLALTLSSIPAMRSEDIMSYLTTGRAADASPSMESDEQEVLTTGASLAVGAALGTVAGQAGQKVGLDVIQVLQDREGGQTLVAGKYVSPPLYLGVRTPIVPPPSPGRSEPERDVAEFEVEYATLRQLLINLQGAGSELRVFLRLRR